jgi:hypothetical protein
VDFCGFLWIFVDFCGFLWIFVDFCGFFTKITQIIIIKKYLTTLCFLVFCNFVKINKIIIKQSFEQWLFEDVGIEFGIDCTEEYIVLQTWLDVSVKVSSITPNPAIEKKCLSLSRNVETWNEKDIYSSFSDFF